VTVTVAEHVLVWIVYETIYCCY